MTTTKEQAIAEMIRRRRRELGHTAAEAARRIGVSRQIFTQWESGHAVPGEVFVADLAAYLDVDERGLILRRHYERVERAKGVYVSSDSRLDVPLALTAA